MAWINLFIRKASPDLPDVSNTQSGAPEARKDKVPPDLPDVPDAISITRSISADRAEAQYAYERLLWCLDAYRAEGLRLHFYAVDPEPQFTMIYPKAFTPSERIMVQGYFLGAVDLIAAHAHELAKGRMSQDWRHAA